MEVLRLLDHVFKQFVTEHATKSTADVFFLLHLTFVHHILYENSNYSIIFIFKNERGGTY